ncbi:hypothetical protein [Pseudofrankia asymbiotica]|uniref:Uncharacterized protein n=1 Tax=Pseudofrankia asymbiotica TaxID=1834516 RepID=A0A1V2I0I6_9ACTN|nr:hypothetical protein [Pseudofrankia asymbiotica]ONH22674.1 hypothetical protein BL253_34920 [Pseudofrankia asymbiotica]
MIVSESRPVDRPLRAAAAHFRRRRRTIQIGIPVLVCAPGLWLWVQLVRTGVSVSWLALFGTWFVATMGVGLVLASRRWLLLLDRLPLASPGCRLAYHALRLDEFAHDPELPGLLSGVRVDAADALDGAAHAARALQRSLDEQTPAGTAAADIAACATSGAEQVRGDILRGVKEFLAIWADLVNELERTVEPGPLSEPSGAELRAEATRRVPADLAEISRVLVGLAQLALIRP